MNYRPKDWEDTRAEIIAKLKHEGLLSYPECIVESTVNAILEALKKEGQPLTMRDGGQLTSIKLPDHFDGHLVFIPEV